MTSIFVAKLDFGVDNQQLQSLFEQFGKVNKATVALDRETGKSRGFGFVEMFNDEEAQEAIKNLDGFEVNGRTLAVKQAEDRGGSRPAPVKRDFPSRDSNSSSDRPAPSRSSDSDSSFNSFSDDAPAAKDFPKKKIVKAKTSNTNIDTTQDGRSKKTKLNPYKKSGKDNIFIEDDDDFDDIDLFGKKEDEDEDEDYSKYLVNADDDDDEDYDDDYEDEDDYED